MKYIIKKGETSGNFIKVPLDSKPFSLPAAAFKLYVWLLNHKNGFEFYKMYMHNGVKLHNKTVDKSLEILNKKGFIKIIKNDNSSDSIIIKSDYQK